MVDYGFFDERFGIVTPQIEIVFCGWLDHRKPGRLHILGTSYFILNFVVLESNFFRRKPIFPFFVLKLNKLKRQL